MPAGTALSSQTRGDDFAHIAAPEITPFKGLDLKPIISTFYAQGTTSGSARAGSRRSQHHHRIQPDRRRPGWHQRVPYTVGLDTRLRMGPFSLDPTVMYQFGNKAIIAPATFGAVAVPGRKYYPDLDAWLIDVRGGFQLGPLLLEGLAMYRRVTPLATRRSGPTRSFQPLTTDTGYLADWGTSITSLGIDYLNAWNEAGGRIAYPGTSIGWDKYGRMQFGAKATYAITPELSVMGGANAHWTAENVDRNGRADGRRGHHAGVHRRRAA